MLIDIFKMEDGIRISAEDARRLGQDLVRAADEAEDHETFHLVDMLDLRMSGVFLRIYVSPHDHPEHVNEKVTQQLKEPKKRGIKAALGRFFERW